MSPAAYGEQKKREALAAAQALGAEALFGPWKDGELRDTEEAARFVADVIRQVKPTHVITHWKTSLHPDHEAAHRIVNAAVLLASLEGFESAHPRHRGVRGVYYADNWEDAEGFVPYLYVDVTRGPRRLEGGRHLATSSSAGGSRPSRTSSTTRPSPACAVLSPASGSPSPSRWTRSRRSACSTRCPEAHGGIDDRHTEPDPAGRARARGRRPPSRRRGGARRRRAPARHRLRRAPGRLRHRAPAARPSSGRRRGTR